jgi:hypothetical protein
VAAASVFPQLESEQNAYCRDCPELARASIEPPAQPREQGSSNTTPTPNMATAPGSGEPTSAARAMLPEKPMIDTAGSATIPL